MLPTSTVQKYIPKNHIRIVTAASLFDGHDAAINIMRRIMISTGAEVIHLGHNRSVDEIVKSAIEEDVQAIAVTSYQGGHVEFLKYMYDLLKNRNADSIKIFAGGGGTILPDEIKDLETYGIAKIYSPDDGRAMGLQGMINDLVSKCDYPEGNIDYIPIDDIKNMDIRAIARAISACENFRENIKNDLVTINKLVKENDTPVLGITGTGGSGKSSLVDEMVLRFLQSNPQKTIAIVSVDPTRQKTGGALLGDRIRMNAINHSNIYMRSLATRGSKSSVSHYIQDAIDILKLAGFDVIMLETSGIGQAQTDVLDYCNCSIYVMTPEYGAATQLEKIDMLDYADIVVINKFDKSGALDALHDVKKQMQRNKEAFDMPLEQMPVFGTIASQFNDDGVNKFFNYLIEKLNEKSGKKFAAYVAEKQKKDIVYIVPPERTRYLSEIAETIKKYNNKTLEESKKALYLYSIKKCIEYYKQSNSEHSVIDELNKKYHEVYGSLNADSKTILKTWEDKKKNYQGEYYTYHVRNKEIKVKAYTESLAHTKIPKVCAPKCEGWGDIITWNMQENFPGQFPYTAGVYPFKREDENPTRMFAGEGIAEKTNKRFHYLSYHMPAVRLSTAFDSVTLYGYNPDKRPDIYGKIGNSGVSISTIDDVKRLYSGFKLTDPSTSVSMTINGPAPIMAAYFFNAAIDQECEAYIQQNGLTEEVKKKIEALYNERNAKKPEYRAEQLPDGHNGLGLLLLGISGDMVLPHEIYNNIKAQTLRKVRGTVQADILKEEQAQNTCIFSIDFALKLMGDMQEYFIKHTINNFYSVSISGYHIAEAGANPVTQLALTLANGFTYVEYYLARGLAIDDFAPNLSFFFSNGLDPEYSVIGRVARRIWAKAMKYKYGANERSQMLKYHIQTSGRSLHSQEIEFNDIRTTLQALYAIYDNCNSLHTNSYDEAITTPTEESVRRALAIQMIINQEYGLAKNQNPLQGAFIIEELTDLVEEAVIAEFNNISIRGGVLGAMETMYQRNKIQEESLYYENKKMSGELPIIGVNTFHSKEGSPIQIPDEVVRATPEEKDVQLESLAQFHRVWKPEATIALQKLKQIVKQHKNVFETLMDVAQYCSLGQLTDALYSVGGMYRRSM